MKQGALVIEGVRYDLSKLETQFSLLKMFKLPPTMAETHRVIRAHNAWTLVKRDRPIKIFEDEHGKVAAVMSPTYSSRIKLTVSRGKYNDAGRLVEQDSASLECGEIAPMVAGF